MRSRPVKLLLLASLMIFVYTSEFPIRIAPRSAIAASFTLWGRILAPAGWGFSSPTVKNPGPEVDANPGDSVTLMLFSGDGVAHAFCVDYEPVPDFTCQTPGEPLSPNFSSTSPQSFTFTAIATPGSYTYFCNIHGQAMSGRFVIPATNGVGRLAT